MRPTILFALGAGVLLACGGKTAGSGDETDGGTSGHDGSSGGSDAPSGSDSPFVQQEASSNTDTGGPFVVCNQGPASGSGGQGSCEIQISETCSDGTTYSADCQCPSGTCSCSEMSGMSGSGGGGIPFTGCPSCPSASAAWTACGFPH